MASSSPSSSPPPPSISLFSSSSSLIQPTAAALTTLALEHIHGLLRELLRITTTDGRVFIGTFAGTDKPLNIILVNAEEYRVGPGQDPDGRYVGQVMLPWKVISKVEARVQPPRPTRASNLDEMFI